MRLLTRINRLITNVLQTAFMAPRQSQWTPSVSPAPKTNRCKRPFVIQCFTGQDRTRQDRTVQMRGPGAQAPSEADLPNASIHHPSSPSTGRMPCSIPNIVGTVFLHRRSQVSANTPSPCEMCVLVRPDMYRSRTPRTSMKHLLHAPSRGHCSLARINAPPQMR